MRNKLKELRIKKGLTHESLAEIIGIKRSSYTNIELGKKNPSFLVASKIKKALGYEKDDIFLNVMCRKGTKSNKAS
ncbi:helix-turn-helix transcriptional regulator [Tepidibacter sp. Z1-5]|uniref:helix-turn-helix transcriptional regulator n=1 Tax=Tepidibacter sp. Z1-5 TaxID=3134138 RepID=UPI0030C5E640